MPPLAAKLPFQAKIWIITLTWFAFGVRVRGLFANHFHADEALFAGWARLIAVWRDPFLLSQAVDKPPVLFYLQALFYPLFGAVEWAARMPNLIASLLLVPLVGLLAWQWYRDGSTAVLATALITCLPLAVQFSATAFIDPLLTFWLILCLFLVGKKRPGLSGLLFGVALVTKYQAVLFLLLVVGLGWLFGWKKRAWLRWFGGAALPMLFLFFWEFTRTGELALWQNQIGNFGGLRLIWSWELWPRFIGWAQQSRFVFGSRVMAGLFLLSQITLWLPRPQAAQKTTAVARHITALLSLFLLAYICLHWLLAIPIWDRYFLPITPLIAIIFAHGVVTMLQSIPLLGQQFRTQVGIKRGLLGLFAILLIFSGWQGRNGRYPIGGQEDADNGAWQIAAFLADEPYGTVLYDHWYSWQWHYHLFDKGVYVSWFPHASALVEDLAVFGGKGRRYIVLPDTTAALPILRELKHAGYAPQPIFHSDTNPGIILYRIGS